MGDVFDVYTEKGNTRYVVDEIKIVPPEDVSVLAAGSEIFGDASNVLPFLLRGERAVAIHRARFYRKNTKNLKAKEPSEHPRTE